MQFAALTIIAPGATLAAQCEAIAAAGCAGVETIVFPTTRLELWSREMQQSTNNAGLQPVVVILGGLALYQPEPMGWIREALEAIAELGAAALLTPEYRAQDPLPLFPPYPGPSSKEQEQVDQTLNEISQLATALGVRIFLEPITQFESRFWRDVDTVLSVCEQLNNLQFGLCLDFHNMNITEANIEASIGRVGTWIRHIHLADSNRRLPGQGHINFATGLAALRAVGYAGWYSFECAVEGDFADQVRQTVHMLEQSINQR